MAIGRRFEDIFSPIPASWDGHDIWILWVVASASEVALISEPLIVYRQHSGQALPFRMEQRRLGLRSDIRPIHERVAEDVCVLLARLTDGANIHRIPAESIALLRRKKQHHS